jgi:hypothetical protein
MGRGASNFHLHIGRDSRERQEEKWRKRMWSFLAFLARNKIRNWKNVLKLDVLVDEPNFISFSRYYFSIPNKALCTYMTEDSGKWPTWRTILFSYMFISVLYMFRATSCSSSGESIVSVQLLVYVTLCRGLK